VSKARRALVGALLFLVMFAGTGLVAQPAAATTTATTQASTQTHLGTTLHAHQKPNGDLKLMKGDKLRAGLIRVKLSSAVHAEGEEGGYDLALFRLRHGVSLSQFRAQLTKAFGQGPVAGQAVEWINHHVRFYGGLGNDQPDHLKYFVVLQGGHYHLADLNQFVEHGAAATRSIKVKGHSNAKLPRTDQALLMVDDDRFKVWSKHGKKHGNKLHRGALSVANYSHDLHFALFDAVKPGTTDRQIQKFFDSGFTGPNPFNEAGRSQSSGVLSPGVKIVIDLRLPRGPYAILCFIPNADGTPHAFVGMHKVVRITGRK
jgi:hypothetical protein